MIIKHGKMLSRQLWEYRRVRRDIPQRFKMRRLKRPIKINSGHQLESISGEHSTQTRTQNAERSERIQSRFRMGPASLYRLRT